MSKHAKHKAHRDADQATVSRRRLRAQARQNETSTLILNSDGKPLCFYPLTTVKWQEAISWEFREKTNIILRHENWAVSSQSETWLVPSVAMTKKFHKRVERVKFGRNNIYLRDAFACQYCGQDFSDNPEALTLDHVVPRAAGGQTRWDNLVACCNSCNGEKGDKTGWKKPRQAPFKPNYNQLLPGYKKTAVIKIRDERWRDFIDSDWTTQLVPAPDTLGEGSRPELIEAHRNQ